MKPSKLLARIVLATVALTLISTLAQLAIVRQISWTGIDWSLLGSLMITVALSFVVLPSRRRGVALAAGVFLLFFGIHNLNTFLELRIFKVGVPDALNFQELVRGFVTAVLFAPVLVVFLARWKADPQLERLTLSPRSSGGWVWRLIAGEVAYIFFYILAGMIIFPFVKTYYANIPMPPPGAFFGTQVFRALVYVTAAFGVTRCLPGKPRPAALALAVAFPMLAGLEPLIYPNTIMPGNIRLAHAIEIGWSNAAYGLLLGFLFTRRSFEKPSAEPKPLVAPQAA